MFLVRHWGQKVIFAAPTPTYTSEDMQGKLCWLPSYVPQRARSSPQTVSGPLCGEEGNVCSRSCRNGPSINGVKAGPSAIPCVWLPSNWSSTVMIYFHANAEDLGSIYPFLQHIQKQFRVSMLAPEYPGYGLLQDQEPCEETSFNAALAALRYLVDEANISYDQVILVGRSLGSGLAVHLASRFPVGGLILVNAFTSPRAVAAMHVGSFLADLTFGEMFANDRRIANVSCPVLFIHGLEDDTVPTDHSRRLFERCRARKLLVTPENMRHNSHLFDNPEFLVLPAIHFFHLPGYRTSQPPTLPPEVFTPPRAAAAAAALDDEHELEGFKGPRLSSSAPVPSPDTLLVGSSPVLRPAFRQDSASVEDGSNGGVPAAPAPRTTSRLAANATERPDSRQASRPVPSEQITGRDIAPRDMSRVAAADCPQKPKVAPR